LDRGGFLLIVRTSFARVLLKQAQPQRLKPIESWPNGTTEVVPFPNQPTTEVVPFPNQPTTKVVPFPNHPLTTEIVALPKTLVGATVVAVVSPHKFGLC
jgi:hypothetical protein